MEVEDVLQIRSTLSMMLSFGDCALCMVLGKEGKQMGLIPNLSHGLVWKQSIVEHVVREDGSWSSLDQSGAFDEMERATFAIMSYSQLCPSQQKKFLPTRPR